MKKTLNTFLFLVLGGMQVMAQVRQPGSPLSLGTAYSSIFSTQTYVPQTTLTAPDVNRLVKEDMSTRHTAFDNPRIGAAVPADFSFPSSGIITMLNDGRQVWRAQIKMSGAPALGLYYDKFHLPDGVKYYLSNANGKQVLGAYTSQVNPADGLWVTEKTQGDIVNLEMDIDAGVDVSQINMHINNVGCFYNSISYLDEYQTEGAVLFAYDSSSACEVNAICSEGTAFLNQRLATVHIEYVKGNFMYAGSGTLMNNVRQDCTPYVLTASHVEPSNSTSNTTFSTWMFYFNYETPTCIYSGARPSSVQSVSGATFNARASYDSSSPKIVGDFLLVQLKTKVPVTYGAYFSGWDISSAAPVGECIGFHHPEGDVKKLSTTTHVFANGNFNGGQQNSHWSVSPWDTGGIEEGSSGSGLFNPSGRLIGDLSGGDANNPTCTTKNSYGDEMANFGEYSKLALNWQYVYQQPSSAATRLQDWLDPDGTGATTLDATAATCFPAGVNQVSTANNTVSVFPSPSTGVVYVNANFSNTSTLKIEVYNIIGNKILETQTPALLNNYMLDLTGSAPGVYMVRIGTGTSIVTRKVLIAK